MRYLFILSFFLGTSVMFAAPAASTISYCYGFRWIKAEFFYKTKTTPFKTIKYPPKVVSKTVATTCPAVKPRQTKRTTVGTNVSKLVTIWYTNKVYTVKKRV